MVESCQVQVFLVAVVYRQDKVFIAVVIDVDYFEERYNQTDCIDVSTVGSNAGNVNNAILAVPVYVVVILDV